MREIILDTETTGLDPYSGHRIIEVGAIEMVNKVVTGKQIHLYINPQRNIPQEAYRIHGISESFLQDKPLFRDVVDEFLAFVGDAQLVIHNAPFDLKFINYELSLLDRMPIEASRAIDTLIMARRAFPGARANLDALCKRFKIDNTKREKHGALLDSQLLAEVYIELTGGRQRSFVLESKANNNSNTVQSKAPAIGNGLIIEPTAAEMDRHQKFIAKLKS